MDQAIIKFANTFYNIEMSIYYWFKSILYERTKKWH